MNDILGLLGEQADAFVAIRRDLHAHPELGFQETRTAALIADLLERFGYRVERGIGGTGVVGQLRRGDGRRSIGLRADFDALPITEVTGLPYASRTDGVMHACGHDGHTAMLLAAAKALAERELFNGTLNLIFQPAEELGGTDSGAARMIADGLFERFPCDAVFGMHNMPGYPQGQLVFRDGAMMASSDTVTIIVSGRGGHAAQPHAAIDPVVAASSLVMALQTVVSRNVDPNGTAVVTVGAFHAGSASNIIAEEARLELSVRALDAGVRRLLEDRIRALARAQAESYGCTAEVDWRYGYPVLVNSAPETALAREVGIALAGEQGIVAEGTALTTSEDFSFMLEAVPGSYLLIGNGDGADAAKLHQPAYDFNDANIAVGAAYWTMLTERYLKKAFAA